MIYITGDTHCPFDISKLKPHHFPEGQILTKEDYVIICGDFGAVWMICYQIYSGVIGWIHSHGLHYLWMEIMRTLNYWMIILYLAGMVERCILLRNL